jgi:hypothetical protein
MRGWSFTIVTIILSSILILVLPCMQLNTNRK